MVNTNKENPAIDTHIKKFKKDLETLDIDSLYIKYLGKKGIVNTLFAGIRDLSSDLKKDVSKDLNVFKSFIEQEIQNKKNSSNNDIKSEKFDLTYPVNPSKLGNLHP